MPLAVTDWTEPTTRAERAAMKAEQEQWRALDRRVELLEQALRQQHMWHLAQTEPDQYGMIPADEYQDSAMCERTLAALHNPAT